MDEEQFAASESAPPSAAAATLTPEPNEESTPVAEPLELTELQAMTPAAVLRPMRRQNGRFPRASLQPSVSIE